MAGGGRGERWRKHRTAGDTLTCWAEGRRQAREGKLGECPGGGEGVGGVKGYGGNEGGGGGGSNPGEHKNEQDCEKEGGDSGWRGSACGGGGRGRMRRTGKGGGYSRVVGREPAGGRGQEGLGFNCTP
ncbi:hypothetical protein SLA2020_002230 [Shorea laevis]